MKTKRMEKIVAVILIMVLTMANFIFLAKESYAMYEELEKQGVVSNHVNIEYDSYFKNDTFKKHSQEETIGKTRALYLYIKVKNSGYLKSGKIKIEDPNFKIATDQTDVALVKGVDVSNNEINLNQIEQGKEVELQIPVVFPKQDTMDLSYFSKPVTTKLTGTYIDENGKEKQIEKTIQIRLDWKADAKAYVGQEIEKYGPISVAGQTKMMMVTSSKTGLEGNTLPVEKTNVSIQAPELNGIKPETVKVYGIGEKGNYSYNNQTGEIQITRENSAFENKVSWGAGEEYRVTYLYPETAKADKLEVTLKANATIKAYNKADTQKAEEEKTIQVTQNKGNAIGSIVAVTPEINKGYMYANSGYETNYQTNWIQEISYHEMMDKTVMQGEADQFVKENGVKEVANTHFKSTSISKDTFDQMIGQEGRLEIYDQKGTKVGEINNSTQLNDQGRMQIDYNGEDVTSIRIETTRPIAEGRIEVSNQKAIGGTTSQNNQQVRDYKQILTKMTAKGEKAGANVAEESSEAVINLKETETTAEVTISNTNLSTVVKNENVEIRGVLRTDSNDKDLYQDPKLEFELPKEVEEIAIKSIDLLFSDELKLKNYELKTNSEGHKVIAIAIEGNQTKYTTDLSKGANIVINTDLTLNKLATNSTKQVTMRYTNNKAVVLSNNGVCSADVNINAPIGIVALNTVANYASDKPEVTSLNNKEQTAEIEIGANSKVATMKLTVINNFGKDVSNPKVLGRVPFIGNKKTTGEELGTNIDTKLKSAIRAQGIAEGAYTIYYSENGTATEEIQDSNNGWTTDIGDMSKAKSYVIVLENYTMAKGSILEFTYEIEIPEGLNHNASAYATYSIYYENKQNDGQVLKEVAIAPTVGMTTGEGPILEANMINNIGDLAKKDQVMTYNITIKNTGNKASEGTKIIVPIPEGANYAEFIKGDHFEPDQYLQKPEVRLVQIEAGTIASNETITKSFHVVPTKVGEIETKATISATNLEKEIETTSVKTVIEQAYMKINLYCTTRAETMGNQTSEYCGRIENISDNTMNNAVASIKVEDNLTYKEASMIGEDGTSTKEGVSYDEKTKTVSFKLGDIGAKGSFKEIKLVAQTKELEKEEQTKEAKVVVSAKADGITEHKSNEVITKISKINLETKITTNVPEGYVKVGDRLDYTVTVKNTSKIDAEYVKVAVTMSNNLKYLKTSYGLKGKVQEGYIFKDGKSQIEITIPAGETLQMVVETTVKNLDPSKPEEDVDSKVEVEAPGSDKVEEDINHKVDEEQGPDENGKYKISGTAWVDENKDGQRDDKEQLLSDIKVSAINATTGKVAQNEKAEDITAVTGENGVYTLSGLDKGSYIVLFNYDTKQYSLTEYQKAGVAENKNSDVVKTKVAGDSSREAAVTNTITIESISKANIDIGLTLSPIFDLTLDKTVSKITVQNSKGTQTKTYDNEKLAKVDLDGKQINNTNLVIEYKMKVTNKGTVEGYAKKIIDYMPKELKFSSELNKDWYTSGNDGIVNNSLANEKIAPGETKEITLVLTKKMTESGNGIVNNMAEILEAYNDYGVADVNSLPGNKKEGEDDMSSADVIIGLKTGGAVLYITLTTTILIAIGAGAYFVNKKVLKM